MSLAKMKFSSVVLVFFIAIAVFTACGEGNVADADSADTELFTEETEIEVEGVQEEKSVENVHTVIIENMEYVPAELKIHRGDLVIFENRGIVEHNVTEFLDGEWTSGNFQPGEKWEKTFDESLKYYCSIHPTMKGTITVIQ